MPHPQRRIAETVRRARVTVRSRFGVRHLQEILAGREVRIGHCIGVVHHRPGH